MISALFTDKDNKIRIKNSGAVSTITAALKEFTQQVTVVLAALKALGNLISVGTFIYKQSRVSFTLGKGGGGAVDVLRRDA